MARCCRVPIFLALLLLSSIPAGAQTISASRSFTDIGPAADACELQTCIAIEPRRTGICAVEVFDASGSMDTNGRFVAAKLGIGQFLDSLRVELGDYASVVTFSGPDRQFGANPQPSSNPPTVTVVQSLDQDFSGAKASISGLSTASVASLTPLAPAIEAAAEVLSACPTGSLPVMIISTDGYPNWASQQQCTITPIAPTGCTEAAIDAADAAKANGIHIVSIGIDLDPQDPADAFGMSLLQAIATSPNDANFYNTLGGLSQSDIYRDLARNVASPRDVALYEPLPDSCWSYVAGSTEGSISADPTLGAIGAVEDLTWQLPSAPHGEDIELCYSMSYNSSCGSSPTSVSVGVGGEASWKLVNGKRVSDPFGVDRFAAIRECAVLIPVELTDFAATADGRDVHLAWHTASERDNAGFAVERSTDSETFQEVAFVEGHGTSLVPAAYRFVDKGVPHGTVRYRLKQVDFDGSFSYSPVAETIIELPSSYFMSQVYPNPLGGRARFDLSVARTQEVRMDLLDVMGRTVKTLSKGPVITGLTHSIELDATGLPAGTYILRVDGENFSTTRLVAVVS